MYVGFDYEGQIENMTLTSAIQDILQITAGSTVPFVLTHLVLTAGTVNQNIMRVQWVWRSTASTTSTASGTLKGKSTSMPAASASLAGGLTALGTAGNLGGAQEWNVTAPLEYNWVPKGIVCPAAGFLCLECMAPFGTTLPVSIWLEGYEVK